MGVSGRAVVAMSALTLMVVDRPPTRAAALPLTFTVRASKTRYAVTDPIVLDLSVGLPATASKRSEGPPRSKPIDARCSRSPW